MLSIESRLNKERLGVEASVIVTIYNQPLTTRLILKSLIAQDFSGCQEVIICDDGSAATLFAELKDSFDKAGIPLKYVWQQDRNIRIAESTNNGIKIAKGRYLLFLDGDMIPGLDFVSKHMSSHTKPKLIVAGNRLWRGLVTNDVYDRFRDRSIQMVLFDLESNWKVDENTKRREEIEQKRRREWLQSPNPWRACITANLSVERNPEVILDENIIGRGNEDWELTYRLSVQFGYIPVYVDNIKAYHLETPSGIANIFRGVATQEDIIQYLRNTCYFFDKCAGLEPEDIFFGFPRVELDESTNQWKVVPRPTNYTKEQLIQKIRQVREWLSAHKVYW